VTLPAGDGVNKEYYPFPDSQPTFIGFEDKVRVYWKERRLSLFVYRV
jgi:hypothetical protein